MAVGSWKILGYPEPKKCSVL